MCFSFSYCFLNNAAPQSFILARSSLTYRWAGKLRRKISPSSNWTVREHWWSSGKISPILWTDSLFFGRPVTVPSNQLPLGHETDSLSLLMCKISKRTIRRKTAYRAPESSTNIICCWISSPDAHHFLTCPRFDDLIVASEVLATPTFKPEKVLKLQWIHEPFQPT